MIGATGLLGKCTVASAHKIASEAEGALYRIQGVALPVGFIINHFAYSILEDRAKKLVSLNVDSIVRCILESIISFQNPARLPHEPYEDPIKSRIA